jgi:4-aminobutyrate aminotransferase-like enzyme
MSSRLPANLASPGLFGSPPVDLAQVGGESFIKAEGLRLTRADGREFLDAIAGTFNLPLGYSHPAVVEACVSQLRRLPHLSSTFASPFAQELLDTLLPFAPIGIEAGWIRDASGSTANEGAVKMAQRFTGASGVISLFRAHHGQTCLMTAMSGAAFRRKGLPSTASQHVLRVPAPYCHRCFYAQRFPECELLCVDRIHDFIDEASGGDVACFIVEPILANGGNIVPPPGYFAAVRQLCDERQIVLIADEVQTGLGRTGYMFASEALGLRPDIITLGKSLGGVGLPIAAILMRPEFDVLERHDHSFSSGGWLVALKAAAATVEVISGPGFLERVRHAGDLLGELLRELAKDHPCVSDVRGMGLMWGVELVDADGVPDPRLATAIVECAYERGLLLRSSEYGRGNVLKIRPSLIATDADLREMTTRLSRAMRDAVR